MLSTNCENHFPCILIYNLTEKHEGCYVFGYVIVYISSDIQSVWLEEMKNGSLYNAESYDIIISESL